MSDEMRRMVVCVPIADLPEAAAQAGSVVRWCGVCGADVWAAQSTLRMLERHPDATVVCNDCAPGLAATEDEVEVRPVAPDEVNHNPLYRATLEEWRRKLGHKR